MFHVPSWKYIKKKHLLALAIFNDSASKDITSIVLHLARLTNLQFRSGLSDSIVIAESIAIKLLVTLGAMETTAKFDAPFLVLGTILAENGRHLNIPMSWISLGRVCGPFEFSAPTSFCGFDRRPCVSISGASPEVGPGATFQLPKVLDLHYPLAALAHELQTAVEV